MKRIAWIALALASLSACSHEKGKRAAPRIEPPARAVDRLLLTGELDAVSSENLVVPKTSQGSIAIRWLEAEGTLVVAGQKVAELDNTAFASALAEQKLTQAKTENELAAQVAQNAITAAEKTFAVEKARLAHEKARIEAAVAPDTMPKRVYQTKQLELERTAVALARATDELSAQLASGKLEIEIRRLAIEKAAREIQAAEAAIGSFALRAPRDGIVVIGEHPWEGRKLEVGDTVWVGTAIVRLPDLRTMKVNALLSDVDDGRVTAGMTATAILDAYPDDRIHGTITDVSPVAREPSEKSWRRSFLVNVALDRTDPARMLPGMSVRIEIGGGS